MLVSRLKVLTLTAVVAAGADAAASVVATAEGAAATDAALAEAAPAETIFPVLSTTATEAKSVWIPNTALNASAWAPVSAVAALAAAVAVAHVSFAVWSAPHVFVRASHIN